MYEAVGVKSTPKLRLEGITNQEVRAWTVEELLLHQVENDSTCPFSLSWQRWLVPREGTRAAREEEPEAATQATAPKKRRRKRMTMKDYQTACGSSVMANLLDALSSEEKSGRGHLEKVEEARYVTSLSAAELIAKLKAHGGKTLTGADSTLRKALGAYVTLPRGRPTPKQPKKRRSR